MKTLLSLSATAALFITPQIASAQTISWGNAVGQHCVDSNSAQTGADWKIELGTFAEGFVPTAANIPLWIANWTALDKADYNSAAGFFSSRANVESPDLAGRQAFIWIYNDHTYQPSSEWVLMTDQDGKGGDDWIVPQASKEPTIFPKNWRVSDASTVIIGGANSLVGCGERNKVAKDDTFQAYRLPEKAVAAAKKQPAKKGVIRFPVVALLEKVLAFKISAID